MIRADAHYTISTHQTLDKTPYAEHSEALMCREKWNGKGQVRDAPSLCDVTTLARFGSHGRRSCMFKSSIKKRLEVFSPNSTEMILVLLSKRFLF